MKRIEHVRSTSDEGASLLAVLIVVGVLGVILAAVTSFGETAELTTVQLHSQANTTYSATSGIDAAINAARQSSQWGVDGKTCPPLNLPASAAGVNAVGVNVTCTPWPGSGAVNVVNNVNNNNRPKYAILTMPLPGDNGFTQNSGNALRVKGDVYSGGDIKIPANGASMQVTGNVLADGVCDPSLAVLGAGNTKTCSPSPVPYPTDPGYPLPSAFDPTIVTATAKTVPATCNANHFAALDPGRYTDVAGLSALMGGNCKNGLVYFRPGIYYFDFGTTTSGTDWTIQDNSVRVLGGLVTGWTDLAASAAGYNDALPCAGTDINQLANSGVTFVFGGASRITLTADKSIQLCAQPQTNEQEISIYGVKDTTTKTYPPVTNKQFSADTGVNAAVAGDTNSYTKPQNATGAPDGTLATTATALASTQATIAQASLKVSSFSSLGSIPDNADVSSVKARITHSDAGSSSDLALCNISVVSSSDPAVECDKDGPNSTGKSKSTYDEFTLSVAAFDTKAKRDAAAVTFTVNEAKCTPKKGGTCTTSVSEAVDSIQLIVSYTTPDDPGLTGERTTCMQSTTSPCYLISTSGVNAQNLTISGTIYAPLAPFSFQLTNNPEGQVFSRGIVARTIAANITPPDTYTGSVFGLPDIVSSTSLDLRKVTFTATVGGTTIGTAVATFDDNKPSVPVKILSWNLNNQ